MLNKLLSGHQPNIDDLIAFFGDAVPSLHDLKNTEQDPLWHAEGDVYRHTSMVLDELYKDINSRTDLSPKQQREVILGALFHDLAKPFTTRKIEVKGVERIGAPGHEAKGRSVLAHALMSFDLSHKEIWSIMSLVGYHQSPKMMVVKSKTKGEYMNLSRKLDRHLVSIVERADMSGRTCTDKSTQLEYIDMFEMFSKEYAPDNWQEEWKDFYLNLLKGRSKSAQDRIYNLAVRAAENNSILSPEDGAFISYQEPENPPELVIFSGPSGSGKSTLIKNHLADHVVISLDQLRFEISGNRFDKTINGQVIQEAMKRLKANLRVGTKVVWDATNIRREHRKGLLSLAEDYKALSTMIVFQEPEKSLFARNANREHPVPEGVLKSQIKSWQFPEADEADRMIIMNESGLALNSFGMLDNQLPYNLIKA